MAKRKFPEKRAPNPVRTVCLVGLVTALVVSWALVALGVIWRRDVPGMGKATGSAFTRELEQYDLFDAPKRVL